MLLEYFAHHSCRISLISKVWSSNAQSRLKASALNTLYQKGRGEVLGDWSRIKQSKLIVQPPVVRTSFLPPARHIEDQPKQSPANLLDRRLPRGNRARIDIDQI